MSRDAVVTVSSDASLTLCDCAAGSTGKITCTSTTVATYYAIRNQGTLTLNSGAVEESRGVYNASSSSVFKPSGGSVSGGEYGIYNYGQVYLSDAPSVSGVKAGIYTAGSSSAIYADGGAEENAAPHSGEPITLAYSSPGHGKTTVRHVTEDTKDKFTFTHENYELTFDEQTNVLQLQGKPQALTWYDIDGGRLTGEGYPATFPYAAELPSSQLPAAPVVEGKLFLGWLYKADGDSDWSNRYWSDSYIFKSVSFQADYIDGFAGGSGTKDDPYQIATVGDLQTLSAIVDKNIPAYNNSNVWYKLTADIDLSNLCGEELGSWMPIGGNCGYSFKANFDGDGHTISNLYIDAEERYQGLFYSLYGATVKNLTLTGQVTAGQPSGALAGEIEDSVVDNVDVTDVVVTPYGYTLDENRTMAYKKAESGNTIDVLGNYKNNWLQTTFSSNGYAVATTDNLEDSVSASAKFINSGKYVQLSYTVTAGDSPIADGKLAVHADIQIGDNDEAAVEVIQDDGGNPIGLKMVDTHTAEEKPDCISRDDQFSLYFGDKNGVTPVDTYWFGVYDERMDSHSTYGYICFAPLNDNTKSSVGTYEQSSGVYTKFSGKDSGFAISWQNISLGAGDYSITAGDLKKLSCDNGKYQLKLKEDGKVYFFPADPTQGKVEVKPNTPDVIASEEVLKELAGTPETGKIITVTLTVEKKAEAEGKTEIENLITTGKKDDMLYLDLSLTKTVTDVNTETTPITDTGDKVLEIAVDYDFTGKQNVTVYRKQILHLRHRVHRPDYHSRDPTQPIQQPHHLLHPYCHCGTGRLHFPQRQDKCPP